MPIVLIPARYASTRFPGKPLVEVKTGVPLIQMVYENAAKSGFETVVVTDDSRIEEAVKKFQGKVCRVDDDVPSGSERIALAYQRFFKSADLVINVQGDEPLLDPLNIKKLAQEHLNSSFDIMTMIKPQKNNNADFYDKNKVKVVWNQKTGECFYFSRAPIPFPRDEAQEINWYLHLGVYSFLPQALIKFTQAPASYYEETEKLEQLRALSIGQKIGAIEVHHQSLGIDTPEDLKKLQGVLCGKTS
jgi:3-deoxy-manno-octulosonate cytidylyltransferase (CMP-KDO synthetase)